MLHSISFNGLPDLHARQQKNRERIIESRQERSKGHQFIDEGGPRVYLLKYLINTMNAYYFSGSGLVGSSKVSKEKLDVRRKRTSTYGKINSTNVRNRITSNRNCSEMEESKKIAAELRLEFGLPQLYIKPRVEAILDIEGMLETHANIGESPVDAIKAYRQNLS